MGFASPMTFASYVAFLAFVTSLAWECRSVSLIAGILGVWS